MSGHSKWSTIKHKKAKTDAQKGKSFSKVSREIIMAAKLGGPDPDANSRLRMVLVKARELNMPNENIKRAIQKGAGNGDDSQLEELVYEAYGPNGVAILIHALTDNRNRTAANLKMILSKGGGSMANQGAVSYLFNQKGIFIFSQGTDLDTVMTLSLEFDVDDIDTKDDGSIEVIVNPDHFEPLHAAFLAQKISPETQTITMLPSTYVQISGEQSDKMLQLIDKLDDDDDVQDVFSNFESL